MAALPLPAHALGSQQGLSLESRTPTYVESGDHDDDSDINSEFEHEAYGPAPGEKPVDSFEIIMSPDDPDNPKNWSKAYRWYITMLSAVLVLNAYVVCTHFLSISLTFLCAPEHSRHLRQQGCFPNSWKSSVSALKWLSSRSRSS